MAQLRQDYQEFVKRGAEVLVIGPDGPNAYSRYWQNESMPMPGLADVGSKVADRFGQQVNWIKLGRMPAIAVVDLAGVIRYQHFGSSMSDIPSNADILAVLDQIKQADHQG
jgi:peroxiredoxin